MYDKVAKFYKLLYGGGARTCPHHTLTSVKFDDFAKVYVFVSFRQITFKLGNFIGFKAFFIVSLTIEVTEIFVLMV